MTIDLKSTISLEIVPYSFLFSKYGRIEIVVHAVSMASSFKTAENHVVEG